jgi:hypothetical protein
VGWNDAPIGAPDGETAVEILGTQSRADLVIAIQLSGGIVFTVYGKVVEMAGRF